MLRLIFLEYWLYATLNLFGYFNMNVETYEFTIEKDAQGKLLISHRTLAGIDGGYGALDKLFLDPSITIEPTKASYEFVEQLFTALHEYLRSKQFTEQGGFSPIEFAENDEISDFQACLEEFISQMVNHCANPTEATYLLLRRLFAINGLTWVVSKPETSECEEVIIRDASHYPIVLASSKITTLWPDNTTFPTTTPRSDHMYSTRWFNFDYLDLHFPIFK